MQEYEIGNYKTITGKYQEWISMSKPVEPVYSSRSLLLPAVAVPVYLFALLLSVDPILAIGISVNSLIIAAAFLLSLIYAGCSFILPYNNTLFPQPLQGLCIISSALFLYKSRHLHPTHICSFSRDGTHNNDERKGIAYTGIAGLFLSLSVFASPVSAFFIPAFVLFMISLRKQFEL